MVAVNNLLGYSDYFNGQALESFGGWVRRKVNNKVCSVKNRLFYRKDISNY
jgi:hypothetical protein